MTEAKTTKDHGEIRSWADALNGAPASVKGTEDDEPGVLRFDFPGGAGEDELTHIDWDEWFEKFDEKGANVCLRTWRVPRRIVEESGDQTRIDIRVLRHGRSV